MTDRKSKDEVRRHNRRLNSRGTLISLVAIAVLCALTYGVLQLGESPIKNLKIRAAGGSVVLHIEPQEAQGTQPQLAFFVDTAEPIYVALYLAIDAQKPQALYLDAKVPPGRHHSVAKGDERFVYPVAEPGHHLHFCLLYAESTDALQKNMDRRLIEAPGPQPLACSDYPAA